MLYETYDLTLKAILRNIPFALLNSEFKENVGYFYFWDSEYIPKVLEQNVVRPPQTHENVRKLQEELAQILKKK